MLDRDDAWHARVRGWWVRAAEEVLVPVTVLPELAYLLGRRIGPAAEAAFVEALAAGEFTVESLLEDDLPRVAELMGIYLDAPIGFVDASIAAVAERVGVLGLLTTDRRHFSLIRPRHTSSFRLLP